jgi:hypothetical protein
VLKDSKMENFRSRLKIEFMLVLAKRNQKRRRMILRSQSQNSAQWLLSIVMRMRWLKRNLESKIGIVIHGKNE